VKISELLVASNNAGKIREIKYALVGIFDKTCSLKEANIHVSPEESGKTYFENALIKAKTAAEFWDGWIISDDSGLEVDALKGGPGIFSSRFAGKNATDEKNNDKLLKLLRNVSGNDRTACFRCVVVLYRGKNGQTLTAEGNCEGIISSKPKGTHGFGYDPLFFIPPLNRTMAELSFEEKMKVSHRARALAALREKVVEYFKKVEGGRKKTGAKCGKRLR